jgi:Sec-independent protein translocase protein TatA
VVLGPKRLPDAARQMGKAMAEFRRVSTGFQAELRDALNEPVDTTPAKASAPPVEPPADPLTTADDEPTA